MRLTITVELTRDDPPPERDSQIDALVERAEPDEDPRLGFRRPPPREDR